MSSAKRRRAASVAPYAITARVRATAVFVIDDAMRRGVGAERAQRLVADHAEGVRHVRRQRDGVALAQRHLAIFPALHPRLRHALEDMKDLEVRMRVHGRGVAGLGGLDANADRRRALVVAEDRLIEGIRAK